MDEDSNVLQEAIKERWSNAGGEKMQRYVGKFWGRQRRERKITAVVEGNHGNYTVSIETKESGIWSTIGCDKVGYAVGIGASS